MQEHGDLHSFMRWSIAFTIHTKLHYNNADTNNCPFNVAKYLISIELGRRTRNKRLLKIVCISIANKGRDYQIF